MRKEPFSSGPTILDGARLSPGLRDGPSGLLQCRTVPTTQDKPAAFLCQEAGGHQLCIYETPVEVIEARNGFGLRLGWAHLHHLHGQPPRSSILKEIFVWPSFRRQGYGKLRESIASQRAHQWHSSILRVLFHEPDALPRNRTAGPEFAQRSGYTLKRRRRTCPLLAAIGEKALE